MYRFAHIAIAPTQVFYETALSYAMVNLKPVVSGHVLIIPRAPHTRFASLSVDEISDLWSTAQRVGRVLEAHHGAASLTYVIQDGPQAGQSVPHVHVHVLPRRDGDFKRNDDVYDELDGARARVDHEARPPRTSAEMADEARTYAALFPSEFVPAVWRAGAASVEGHAHAHTHQA